jgi:hypothetical protein
VDDLRRAARGRLKFALQKIFFAGKLWASG